MDDTSPTPAISVEELAEQLYRKRKARELTLEQASQQIGVSPATLSRWERQRHRDDGAAVGKAPLAPDTRTLTAITRWLGVPLSQLIEVGSPELAHGVVHQEGESVPDMVEAHLRADRNLDGETALTLARMFRLAYEQFSRLSQPAPTLEQPQERTDDDGQEAAPRRD